MEDDAIQHSMQEELVDHIECKPLYVVEIKGHRGACSIAFDDPARALKSMADLIQHGFHDVRICNAAGHALALEDVRLLAGR